MALATLASVPLARGVVRPLNCSPRGRHGRAIRRASLPKVRGYAEVASLAIAHLHAGGRQRREGLVEARGEAERAAGRARDAHARLTRALEMLPEGIVILDAEDRCCGTSAMPGSTAPTRELASAASARTGAQVGRQRKISAAPEEAWIRRARFTVTPSRKASTSSSAGGRWLRVESVAWPTAAPSGARRHRQLKQRNRSASVPEQPGAMWVTTRDVPLLRSTTPLAHYGYSRARFLAMTISTSARPRTATRSSGGTELGFSGNRAGAIPADGTAIRSPRIPASSIMRAGPKLVAIID
jgi:hypothetical protein